MPLPEAQAAAVGIDIAHGASGLFCFVRQEAA
jgi:hypothetical protein